jgi:hypothetical protein
MKRAIKLGLLLALVFTAGATTALTIILTGPATYADHPGY